MKIRLLNGGHQLISNAGEILDAKHLSGCMVHPRIAASFRTSAPNEIAPHVDTVPGTTQQAYLETVAARLPNPQIVDTVRRVAFDGSARQTGSVLPTHKDVFTLFPGWRSARRCGRGCVRARVMMAA